jgi:hypothetical protein
VDGDASYLAFGISPLASMLREGIKHLGRTHNTVNAFKS